MSHADVEPAHHLSPLGLGLICLQHMLAPEAVPSVHEAEDAEGTHTVPQGKAVGLDEGLGRLDVRPGSLAKDKVSKQELAAAVVNRGDEGPLLLAKGKQRWIEASC